MTAETPEEVNELRSYLLGLTSAQTGTSSGAAMFPAGSLYVRHNAEQPAAPQCLERYVARLWLTDQNRQEAAVADLVSLFGRLWHYTPLCEGATIRQAVPVRDGSKKQQEPREKWDRLMTPRYNIDVIELTAEKLGVFLSGPVSLGALLKQRTVEAVARVKESTGKEPTVYGPYHTPPRLRLKCDAFMLEAFTYVEAAGYVGD